jgi:hypothetical protein
MTVDIKKSGGEATAKYFNFQSSCVVISCGRWELVNYQTALALMLLRGLWAGKF